MRRNCHKYLAILVWTKGSDLAHTIQPHTSNIGKVEKFLEVLKQGWIGCW